ncbi:MAG: septum formation initiator family protein [Lachnospiraceae bacterium]|nr:septum formation initiator family protein [Lachnospiraceae bacterium]
MSGRRKSSIKNTKSQHGASMKLIAVLVIAVCSVLGFRTWRVNQETKQYAEVRDVLIEEIKEEEARTGELEERAEYLSSDKYIEDVAREKLGLIYEDEIIFRKSGR